MKNYNLSEFIGKTIFDKRGDFKGTVKSLAFDKRYNFLKYFICFDDEDELYFSLKKVLSVSDDSVIISGFSNLKTEPQNNNPMNILIMTFQGEFCGQIMDTICDENGMVQYFKTDKTEDISISQISTFGKNAFILKNTKDDKISPNSTYVVSLTNIVEKPLEESSVKLVEKPQENSVKLVEQPQESLLKLVKQPQESSVKLVEQPQENLVKLVEQPQESSVKLVEQPQESSVKLVKKSPAENVLEETKIGEAQENKNDCFLSENKGEQNIIINYENNRSFLCNAKLLLGRTVQENIKYKGENLFYRGEKIYNTTIEKARKYNKLFELLIKSRT